MAWIGALLAGVMLLGRRRYAGSPTVSIHGFSALLVLLLVAGCDSGQEGGRLSHAVADSRWLKEDLIRGNLEPRLRHGLLPSGYYQPNLRYDWAPKLEQKATLVSQSRAIYLFAVGYEVTRDRRYLEASTRAADYLLSHFADRASDGRWVRGVMPDGQVVDRGFHAYGHAQAIFALAHAFKVSGDRKYLDAANASIDFVARVAAGDPNGIIPHTTDYGGKVRDPEYYWWSQTELLRGLAHFVVHRGRDDLRGQFQKSLRYVREHYIDPVYGGWYRKPDGKTDDKGNDWKVGYHVAMMITELLRLNGEPFRTGAEILL